MYIVQGHERQNLGQEMEKIILQPLIYMYQLPLVVNVQAHQERSGCQKFYWNLNLTECLDALINWGLVICTKYDNIDIHHIVL